MTFSQQLALLFAVLILGMLAAAIVIERARPEQLDEWPTATPPTPEPTPKPEPFDWHTDPQIRGPYDWQASQ